VTAGVGCVSSGANASVVIFNMNDITMQDPLGINVGLSVNDGTFVLGVADTNYSADSYFGVSYTSGTPIIFTRGSDLEGLEESSSYTGGAYFYSNAGFYNGAVAGDQNFANISFDGEDVFEAVGQFSFDGAGNGFLIAIATNNDISNPQDLSNGDGEALSISAGVAAIQAAQVPEPSSIALFALGSLGLAARRNRKK